MLLLIGLKISLGTKMKHTLPRRIDSAQLQLTGVVKVKAYKHLEQIKWRNIIGTN